jgi:CRP/FNR family transcriptional regulator, cyclic AMP receptor protein
VDVATTVRLLELEPDLGRFMTEADAEVLEGLLVPVVEVPAGDLDLGGVLADHSAFGLLLLGGMLARRVVVSGAATLRLVGPGDVVSAAPAAASMLVAGSGWRAAAPTRMAVLGREVLLAAHRAPRLVAGLQVRGAEQADRVMLQLAICQLPRVEDRVLSMLWLLAESWGQVTMHGTALRLHLTHETIGGLVGARRSTVTLALGQLTDDGAILRHERGWLLLQPAPVNDTVAEAQPDPELLTPLAPIERVHNGRPPDAGELAARLMEQRAVTEQLREVRDEARRRLAQDLDRLVETRRRSLELREQARGHRGSDGSRLAGLHHHDDTGGRVGPVEGDADHAAAEVPSAAVDGVED